MTLEQTHELLGCVTTVKACKPWFHYFVFDTYSLTFKPVDPAMALARHCRYTVLMWEFYLSLWVNVDFIVRKNTLNMF